MDVLVMIDTGKGFFPARSQDERETWQISGPHHPTAAIYVIGVDGRRDSPRPFAQPSWPAVPRDAGCVHDTYPTGVYFGTRSGELFDGVDEGDSWRSITSRLPDVPCVRSVSVS